MYQEVLFRSSNDPAQSLSEKWHEVVDLGRLDCVLLQCCFAEQCGFHQKSVRKRATYN
ncbi:hypothetical protein LINGRAHAP2_LOCUS14285 [Linum grandiflorum]